MLNPSLKKRIDSAWANAKGWITDFDGSPTITLLVNAPPDPLLPGLNTLAGETENFRLTSIPTAHPDAPQFIPLASLPEHLGLLQEGKLAELSANYTAHLDAFDLDIHLLVHPVGGGKAAVELDWWGDQAFPDDNDPPTRFAALADYFIRLQALFSAPQIFITPESGKDPDSGSEEWVEI